MHATGVLYLPDDLTAEAAPLPDWLARTLLDRGIGRRLRTSTMQREAPAVRKDVEKVVKDALDKIARRL